MTTFYGAHVCKKLSSVIAQMSKPAPEVADLADEVALARTQVVEALKIVSLCHDPPPAADGEKIEISRETRLAASQALSASLDLVRRLVDTMNRVQVSQRDRVPRTHLAFLTSQFMRVVKETLKDRDPELAVELVEALSAMPMPDPSENTMVELTFD